MMSFYSWNSFCFMKCFVFVFILLRPACFYWSKLYNLCNHLQWWTGKPWAPHQRLQSGWDSHNQNLWEQNIKSSSRMLDITISVGLSGKQTRMSARASLNLIISFERCTCTANLLSPSSGSEVNYKRTVPGCAPGSSQRLQTACSMQPPLMQAQSSHVRSALWVNTSL